MACDECVSLRVVAKQQREVIEELAHFLLDVKEAIRSNAPDAVWMLHGPETACDAIDRVLAENDLVPKQ